MSDYRHIPAPGAGFGRSPVLGESRKSGHRLVVRPEAAEALMREALEYGQPTGAGIHREATRGGPSSQWVRELHRRLLTEASDHRAAATPIRQGPGGLFIHVSMQGRIDGPRFGRWPTVTGGGAWCAAEIGPYRTVEAACAAWNALVAKLKDEHEAAIAAERSAKAAAVQAEIDARNAASNARRAAHRGAEEQMVRDALPIGWAMKIEVEYVRVTAPDGRSWRALTADGAYGGEPSMPATWCTVDDVADAARAPFTSMPASRYIRGLPWEQPAPETPASVASLAAKWGR